MGTYALFGAITFRVHVYKINEFQSKNQIKILRFNRRYTSTGEMYTKLPSSRYGVEKIQSDENFFSKKG